MTTAATGLLTRQERRLKPELQHPNSSGCVVLSRQIGGSFAVSGADLGSGEKSPREWLVLAVRLAQRQRGDRFRHFVTEVKRVRGIERAKLFQQRERVAAMP